MEQLSGTQRDGFLGVGDALEDHLLVGLKDRRSIERYPGEIPVGYPWCCCGNSCHISTPAGQIAGKPLFCKYSKPPREFSPSIQLQEPWRRPNIRETLYCWWGREQERISWNFAVFPVFAKHFTISPAHPPRALGLTEQEAAIMFEPTFVNLADAYLCADCEAVGNSANRCPRCQSDALLAITRAIPRHRDSIRIICQPREEHILTAA